MTAVELQDFSAEAIAAALGAQEERVANPEPVGAIAPPTDGDTPYRYLRPLRDAAEELAAQARTLRTGERIYTGLDPFDQAMRGLGPRELMLVNGYSGSGKTLFVTQMMYHNKHKRIALFTADEDRVLVLAKLVSLIHGISAEDLEYAIASGDKGAEAMVLDTATQHFPNLIVFDDVADIRRMNIALGEARDWWGDKEQLAIFDYAGLLQHGDGGEGNVVGKIDALKAWGKQHQLPLVVMHQSSRSKGADGHVVTMDSGTHGGEQQATFVVGVRRKRNYWGAQVRDLEERLATTTRNADALGDQLREAVAELDRHRETVTFSVVKNKRPPGHLVDEIDYKLDPATGKVSEFRAAVSPPPIVPQQVERSEPRKPWEERPLPGMMDEEPF